MFNFVKKGAVSMFIVQLCQNFCQKGPVSMFIELCQQKIQKGPVGLDSCILPTRGWTFCRRQLPARTAQSLLQVKKWKSKPLEEKNINYKSRAIILIISNAAGRVQPQRRSPAERARGWLRFNSLQKEILLFWCKTANKQTKATSRRNPRRICLFKDHFIFSRL